MADASENPRRASALVRLRRMGIDTYQTPVIYMRRACAVCRHPFQGVSVFLGRSRRSPRGELPEA
jgi:hypothetical protein